MYNEDKIKVYLVDTGNEFKKLTREELTKRGLRVTGEASDGHEALSQICKHRPDAVLLDLWFPGLDCPTLMKEVRRVLGNETPKFILVTGINNKELIEEAFRAGAANCMLKPFDYDSLVNKIKQTVTQKQGQESGGRTIWKHRSPRSYIRWAFRLTSRVISIYAAPSSWWFETTA